MRYALALAAAALLAPPPLRAADPPVTFQIQPVGRVLDDVRAVASLIGGEKAVQALNAAIKDRFGDKGFEGLDLTRPVVGYVVLAPKAEDVTAVLAVPVTNEKDFLALCDRAIGMPPKDLGKGLYALPALDPGHKARLRFSDQYAYVSHGANPEPALDAKALVPPNKLFDPADQALFAGKFHFDRLTPELKAAVPQHLAELKKRLSEGGPNGGLPLDRQDREIFKPLAEGFEKLLGRYVLLLGGADTAALRLNLDVATGELGVETALAAKPDTALAKLIAGHQPTGNKFGALLTADTAAGFMFRLPLFSDELKGGTVKMLEEGQKAAGQAGPAKDLTDELFKGLIRTVKTGEVDVVGAVRGPDKGGAFTAVVAFAFEDPAALEKEFRKVVEKELPVGEQARIKWDADKLGKTSIHTFQLHSEGGWLDFSKPFGGDKASVALAFAPTGVFVVVGPDAVATMKATLAVKPTAAPVLDVLVNPARVKKLVERSGGPGQDVERVLGAEDKLISAMSLHFTGGKELKVRYAINLRLFSWGIVSSDRVPAEFDAPKK